MEFAGKGRMITLHSNRRVQAVGDVHLPKKKQSPQMSCTEDQVSSTLRSRVSLLGIE
jgi:hypothetical protein